jgi:phage shock protein B
MAAVSTVSSIAVGTIFIVMIVFGSILVGLAIIAWAIVRLITGGRGERSGNAEESKMIQELYQGLSRMERRVETLETLLLEREGKGGRS